MFNVKFVLLWIGYCGLLKKLQQIAQHELTVPDRYSALILIFKLSNNKLIIYIFNKFIIKYLQTSKTNKKNIKNDIKIQIVTKELIFAGLTIVLILF